MKKIKFFNEQSEHRYKQLALKSAGGQYDIQLPECITDKEISALQINADHAGIAGDSSDIILHCSDGIILPISLKYNNLSIKHPRPNSLKCCNLPDQYYSEFKELNDKWYKNFSDSGYCVFSEVSKSDKFKMYRQFNELVLKHIVSIDQVVALFKFCTSIDQYLLVYEPKRGVLNYYRIKDSSSTDLPVLVSDTTFKTGILSFRLHTASKSITPTLSLKYDVTVSSKEELCELLATSTSTSTSTSMQCKATTKKGTQCKNNGKYDGFCKLHKVTKTPPTGVIFHS